MKKLIKLESTKDFLFVYWQLTDFCNFKCNYCVPSLNEGNYSIKNQHLVPTNDQIRNFLKNIIEVKKNKELYFSLSGGEPTLHPMFREIINELYSVSNIEVITNGSRSTNWWRSLDNIPHLVRISLHPEYTDIKKINKLSSIILERQSLLRLNLSMDPERWEQSMELYNQLDSELKQFVKPKILHDWKNKQRPMMKYTDDQLSWIKTVFSQTVDGNEDNNLWQYTVATYDNGDKNKLDFVHASIYDHNYLGWKCSAGSNSISINTLGIIHAGLCKSIPMGTINNFKIHDEYITCKFLNCQCPTDLLIPKYKQL